MEETIPIIEAADIPDIQTDTNFAENLIKSVFNDTSKDKPVTTKTKRISVKKQKQDDFVIQVAPLVAVALCMLANILVQEPYTVLAPNPQEAESIVTPLVRMLSRQMSITAKLSDNSLDILAALTAAAIYGERIYHDYTIISRDRKDTVEANRADNRGVYVNNQQPAASQDSQTNHRTNSEQATNHVGQSSDVISDLLRQDAIGRKQYGLGQ